MNQSIVHSSEPILLVGGGESDTALLAALIGRCPVRVAADGGAEALLRAGQMPDAVIGDLDSISQDTRDRIAADRIHHIPEQNSTDFDKCLRNISAPLIYGTGFLGQRLDHELAALTVLAMRPDRRCILAGEKDVVALCPPRLSIELDAGTRFSLFPMGPVTGESSGLRWPIQSLNFAPGTRVGTSNETDSARVELRVGAPLMLVILPVEQLPQLAQALLCAPETWPVRA